MLKLAYKLMAAVLAGGLWIFYRLGGGGSHRDEIKELLQETKNKITQ
jgi:hypothetical protein